MAVTFILGRAGAGKTRFCLDAIERALSESLREHLILLVPEQASFQMERTLAVESSRHGYSQAEVLSFSRLAFRVWDELGTPPPLIRETARALALRVVAARDENALHLFRSAAQTAGFFTQLERLLAEMLTEGVMPEQLAKITADLADLRLRQKADDIVTLFKGYLDWLGPVRLDPAMRLRCLREKLHLLPWLKTARVWVDGFAGFTAEELETLTVLGRHAKEMSITLLCDPAEMSTAKKSDSLSLFHKTHETYLQLRSLLDNAGVEMKADIGLTPEIMPRFEPSPALNRLEYGLATGGQVKGESDQTAVRIVACESHRDELREAARYIRRSIIESQGTLRYRDFAVVARDLEPFADTVMAAFEEFEIPYFLDRRQPMRGHPLSRFVEALLEAATRDYPPDAMRRLLRTGLMPTSSEEAEAIESVLRIREKLKGQSAWRRESWSAGERSEDDTRDARTRIMTGIDGLLNVAQAEKELSGSEWAKLIFDACEALGVQSQLETWIREAERDGNWRGAELHRRAWDAFCDVLADIHDVLVDSVPLSVVVDTLKASLSEVTLGLTPPTLDQVLVSSIERSRHPDIKHAWVFAFNEGVFPARPGDENVFSTLERATLSAAGLAAPSPHADDIFDERLLAYIAFTRASAGLTISFATADERGELMPPSPLLEEVTRVLPMVQIEHADSTLPPVSINEFIRRYYETRHSVEVDASAKRRYEVLRQELSQNRVFAPVLASSMRGERHHNQPTKIGNCRKPADEANAFWITSASEAEEYLQCPFKHFLRYGLGLAESVGPTPLSWDLGSMTHEVLAETVRLAIRSQQSVKVISDDDWTAFYDRACDIIAKKAARKASREDEQSKFLTSLQRTRIKDVVLAHADRWRRGDYEPWLVEQEFGRESSGWRALEIKASNGSVLVQGKIDRVDRSAGNTPALLVYDYKTSAHSIIKDFLTGDRLQLFLYANMLQACVDERSSVEGMLLAPTQPAVKVLDTKQVSELNEAEQRMHMFKPRGMFSHRAGALLDRVVEPGGTSAVANIKLKKDGGINKQARDWVEHVEIQDRMKLATMTVQCAAEGVAKGDVSVSPMVENRTLACSRCNYKEVCRMDRQYNTPRLAEAVLPTLPSLRELAEKGDKE